MKVALSAHTSPKTRHLKDFIHRLDGLCKIEFSSITLNNGLEGFYIGINLSEFEPKDLFVTHFRNYKAEQVFEFDLNLKLEKYLTNTYDEFKLNLFEDLELGLNEVFEKKLKNTLLGTLVISVFEKVLLGESSQNIETLLLEMSKDKTQKTKKEKPKVYKAIAENKFWKLIEQSFVPGKDFRANIRALESQLSQLKDEEIIGFDIALRGYVEKLGSEFVINKAKICNDYVTDDSFIYLRYKLVTKGKAFFDELISEEESSFIDVYSFDEGEELIHSADNAIERKHGGDYNSDMPSDVASKVFGPLL